MFVEEVDPKLHGVFIFFDVLVCFSRAPGMPSNNLNPVDELLHRLAYAWLIRKNCHNLVMTPLAINTPI